MGLQKVKIEMKGTGGTRWCRREVAKNASKKLRRKKSKQLCAKYAHTQKE